MGSRAAAGPGRSAAARTTSGARERAFPPLVISPFLRGNSCVDHTQYDTTSILATIEQRFGLPALSSRDAAVNDLSSVFRAHP